MKKEGFQCDNHLGYHPQSKLETRVGSTKPESRDLPPRIGLCPSVALYEA